jgi:hypothetical protein
VRLRAWQLRGQAHHVREHGRAAGHEDEWKVAIELNNFELLAMELVRLMLVSVPGIQGLATVEFSPVTGHPMWWRWSSLAKQPRELDRFCC